MEKLRIKKELTNEEIIERLKAQEKKTYRTN